MNKESIEDIISEFWYSDDNFVHLLLENPVLREEVDRDPSIMLNRKILLKSGNFNKTLLLKYGDILKNVEIEVCYYDSIEFIRRFLRSVPNVENLVISNDHKSIFGFFFNMNKVINLELRTAKYIKCWLKDIDWDYNHYLKEKLHLKKLKVLDFRRNAFGRKAYSQLLHLLFNADELEKLSISLPREVDIEVFKKFLCNQKKLKVLELQGIGIEKLFLEDIPNVNFKLKMLKISGKFSNIEGFSNFLAVHNKIEKIIVPSENSNILEVILRKLKKLKKLSLSTLGIRRNTEFYETFKKEKFKLLKLEDLSIINSDEELFPLSDVLEMCPNVKIVDIKSLNMEHGTGFNSLKNLECLIVDSFNPVSLFNVKMENLKFFSCNKSDFYSNGFFWKHFLKNHPNLQSVSICFEHISIASIIEEIRVIIEALLDMEQLTNFFFTSEIRRTESLNYLNNIPQNTLELGIFPGQKLIRFNSEFQNQCPEILSIIAIMYDNYEFRREHEFFRIMKNLRHLMHL